MRIVSKKELAKMPNGTLYCQYIPDILVGDFEVIAGHQDDGHFLGTLPLSPTWLGSADERPTNWATIDISSYEYSDDETFAVFDKTEIRAMITVLEYALAGGGFDIDDFEDTYFYRDKAINEKEIEEWL